MKDTAYLVLAAGGIRRMNKGMPALVAGEVAVKITVEAPAACFRQPFTEAKLILDERHIIRPEAAVTVEEPPSPEAVNG